MSRSIEPASEAYRDAVFHTPSARVRPLTAQISGLIGEKRNPALMDIGCGAGEQALDLAQCLPEASIVGVDIAPENIRLATARASATGLEDRVRFVCADYCAYSPGSPFDVAYSYSTLHLIPATPDQLFEKIGTELVEGGIFANVIPYVCAYNYFLRELRRVFRAARSDVTDRLILAIGRRLHAHDMDIRTLEERIMYMYELPRMFDGGSLHAIAARHGLGVRAMYPQKHASLAQMKHRLTVFERRTSTR